MINKGERILRILMVTPGFYPIIGGTETIVQTLSEELNKIGIKTDVMTFNMNKKWSPKWIGKTEEIDGITIFRIPALNWLPKVNSPRVKLQINLIPGRFSHIMKKYDIIHFHEAELSFPFFSYFVRKPKILHLHGIGFDYLKKYHLTRFLLKRVAHIFFAITKQMKNDLIKLGFPQDKIIYFPNFINPKIFIPRKNKLSNTILYVGRISPHKGLHILLKSLNHIRTPVNLEIIGPPDTNLSYYQDIINFIKKEKQMGRHKIKYFGRVDQDTLIEAYQKSSIFVLPSLFEPFGIVLLEAMSCETPVIATYTGGIPEIVKNNYNGFLVPVNNPLKLAEAIEYLLENENIRIKFGKNGRKWVIENFSLETSVTRLCKIYEKIIHN